MAPDDTTDEESLLPEEDDETGIANAYLDMIHSLLWHFCDMQSKFCDMQSKWKTNFKTK